MFANVLFGCILDDSKVLEILDFLPMYRNFSPCHHTKLFKKVFKIGNKINLKICLAAEFSTFSACRLKTIRFTSSSLFSSRTHRVGECVTRAQQDIINCLHAFGYAIQTVWQRMTSWLEASKKALIRWFKLLKMISTAIIIITMDIATDIYTGWQLWM